MSGTQSQNYATHYLLSLIHVLKYCDICILFLALAIAQHCPEEQEQLLVLWLFSSSFTDQPHTVLSF